jgi:phospholipase/carboxylesterase
VAILSGALDPIVPADNARRLAGALRDSGAEVQHHILPSGHALTQSDVALARDWIREL